MAGTYRYVDGDSLWSLILSVQKEFHARPPYELDDERHPNSLRLVAIDCLERMGKREQRAVLTDLIERNPSLCVERTENDIFPYASAPVDYVADLICAVVEQVLRRNEVVRDEDDWRLALSAESLGELEEQ
ncbi:MAG TPA: hypothetical protein VGX26_08655 [Solirubrobacteraceae bacterium]|jgi:hypothetical protein|nr:hypothetical protein [Solirubrobacteraceae bacterium]